MDLKENFIKAEHTETGEIITLIETATLVNDVAETETIKIYEDTKDETFDLFNFVQGTALKLVEERGFYTGVFVNHFKNKQYSILGVTCIKEEDYMLYRAEYGEGKVYIRPLEMFLSEVDKNKYPDVKQKYRFELINTLTDTGRYVDEMFPQYRKAPVVVSQSLIENEPVLVYRNSDGDTRTADKVASFRDFAIANDMHRQDVRNIMNEIAFDIMQNGRKHDFTKKVYEPQFYNDYKNTIEKGANFVEGEWYKLHCENEKHHEEGYKLHKDELTLLDIIEMMVDRISSAAARSGEVKCYDINLSQEEIMKCFDNTIEYIKDKVKIADK